ncbi:MAG: hypothetical protein JXM70_04435, partial [Pirellulales bacterium]|nr:hypothetical protein [Pirellulales bacterium]
GMVWESVPLRSGLERLSQAHDVTIFLDRRVDPGKIITFSAKDIPLFDLLSKMAEHEGLAVTSLGKVVYMGPPPAARLLKTLAAICHDEISGKSLHRRTGIQIDHAMDWPVLTVPREYLTLLASERRVRFVGLDRVPHDLWPAGQLPAMPFADQLTLLLIGFDLKIRPLSDGSGLEIVPITGKEQLTRQYHLPARQLRNLQKIKQIVPNAHVSSDRQTVVVRGLAEDHEQIADVLYGQGSMRTEQSLPPRGRRAQKQYTLRIVEKPIGPVLRQLASSLGLDIVFDDTAIQEAGISLTQRVSFTVEKGSLDDLLTAAVEPAGLAYHLHGKTLYIAPANQH